MLPHWGARARFWLSPRRLLAQRRRLAPPPALVVEGGSRGARPASSFCCSPVLSSTMLAPSRTRRPLARSSRGGGGSLAFFFPRVAPRPPSEAGARDAPRRWSSSPALWRRQTYTSLVQGPSRDAFGGETPTTIIIITHTRRQPTSCHNSISRRVRKAVSGGASEQKQQRRAGRARAGDTARDADARAAAGVVAVDGLSVPFFCPKQPAAA